MSLQIGILAWGSLLWEGGIEFDQRRDRWRLDGPTVKIEFSRISATRLGALTLVIDERHGTPTRVAWSLSTRNNLESAVDELKRREGCMARDIATFDVRSAIAPSERIASIAAWAKERHLDAVVWTALKSNFEVKAKRPFSVDEAVAYIQRLPAPAKLRAGEYVRRAPAFVNTPVRAALQKAPWFTELADPPINAVTKEFDGQSEGN